jgi:uncharacterized protein YndB with AHSA1/START domain
MMTMTEHRLEVSLPSDEEILIRRSFDAPAALVYRAWTTPELVAQWWPGERGVMKSCEIDLRVGGKWRYVMTANAGFDVAFHGEYREIVPHDLVASTEVFEGFPDAEALSAVRFAEADGRTEVSILVTHSCREHRDLHLNSGMEGGLRESMDRLGRLVSELA